jgi:hypothetical protein
VAVADNDGAVVGDSFAGIEGRTERDRKDDPKGSRMWRQKSPASTDLDKAAAAARLEGPCYSREYN